LIGQKTYDTFCPNYAANNYGDFFDYFKILLKFENGITGEIELGTYFLESLMKKVKIGIAGCGGIANQKHMPSLKECGEKNEIVAFCDIIAERDQKAAKEYGAKGAKVYTDYSELLANKEVEVVHVLTPNVAHCPITVAAWKKSGRKSTIGYQNRFRSEIQALHQSCQAGELGDIYYAKAHAVRRRAIPKWGVFLNKALQGGGPLIDIGTHALDITLWMMNNYDVESVSGSVFYKLGNLPQVIEGNMFGPWDPETYEVEDSAVGFIKMKDGATIAFGADQWPGGQNLATTPKIWREMFSVIDSEHFGLNYDPSHFVWQMMDYIKPIYEFKDKIFYVHYKDIKVYKDKLNDTGIMAYPLEFMSPKLPGLGDVDWAKYVSALTDIGYNGYTCIEVEDRAFEDSDDSVRKSLLLSQRSKRPIMRQKFVRVAMELLAESVSMKIVKYAMTSLNQFRDYMPPGQIPVIFMMTAICSCFRGILWDMR